MKNNQDDFTQKIIDIDIATVAKVVFHGRRFYLSLRKADAEFWELQSGDRVLVKLVKLKRNPQRTRHPYRKEVREDG